MKKVEQRRMLNSFRFSFVPAASLAGVHLPLEEIALTSSAQIRKLEVVVEELDKRLDRRDPEWDVSCESCWQTGWEGRGFHQRSSLSGFEQLWLFLMAAKKEPQRWIFQAMSTFAPPIVIFQVKTCFFVYNIIWAYIDGIITDLVCPQLIFDLVEHSPFQFSVMTTSQGSVYWQNLEGAHLARCFRLDEVCGCWFSDPQERSPGHSPSAGCHGETFPARTGVALRREGSSCARGSKSAPRAGKSSGSSVSSRRRPVQVSGTGIRSDVRSEVLTGERWRSLLRSLCLEQNVSLLLVFVWCCPQPFGEPRLHPRWVKKSICQLLCFPT